MTPEEKILVQYRLERAKEAVDEARILFEAGHLNTYVNRLYYACFYAVSALLLTKDLSTSKHTHLRALFHKEFIRTGLIPAEHGKFFDLLLNNRQKSDYADLIVYQAEEIEDWLEKTTGFVMYIAEMIPQT